MSKALLGAIFALVMTAAGPLRALTYECDLKAHTRYGWISPWLTLIMAKDFSSGVVYDYFVHETFGEPISIRIRRTSANKLRLDWRIEDSEIGNSVSKISFDVTASLDLRNGKMRMRVFLNGGDILPHGSGTCELEKPGKRKKKK